jgi:hypothetical protein
VIFKDRPAPKSSFLAIVREGQDCGPQE